MTIRNVRIVTPSGVTDNGYVSFSGGIITEIGKEYRGTDPAYDGQNCLLMPGFIDLHTHGACDIDFMEASPEEIKRVADKLYSEGTTTFLATTLTSDRESLKKVCARVKEARKTVPSLYGIHLEGPYISEKYKGAQNAAYIRNPDFSEIENLNEISGGNIRYISMAPEKEGAMDFISKCTSNGIVCSAGHTDATFKEIEKAISCGLRSTTHVHNAMSGYHHRAPGVVAAAMFFDSLYSECICDRIHVCDETLKTFYKIKGSKRFMIITDSLSAKYGEKEKFKLFGLDCVRRNGAAYLETGNLAGSLLSMNRGVKNMRDVTGATLPELSEISSLNQACCLGLADRGEIAVGKAADFVLLDDGFNVNETYKGGKKVFENT